MHPFYGPSSRLLEEGTYWWMGLASMAIYLLFWAVVIAIAIRLFKKYCIGSELSKTREDTAITILRERYAKGEIDSEEFRKKKADLE